MFSQALSEKIKDQSSALVISFPAGGGGGGVGGLMWGLCLLCISKFLYFPTGGGFFSSKVPGTWQSQTPNRTSRRTSGLHFGSLKTEQTLETSRSDEKLNLNFFFLNTMQGAINHSYYCI